MIQIKLNHIKSNQIESHHIESYQQCNMMKRRDREGSRKMAFLNFQKKNVKSHQRM